MSLIELCERIEELCDSLPLDEQRAIRRSYNKTFTLVDLTTAELCVPTESARKRLQDLLASIERTKLLFV